VDIGIVCNDRETATVEEMIREADRLARNGSWDVVAGKDPLNDLSRAHKKRAGYRDYLQA
jgi:hypothetical protein